MHILQESASPQNIKVIPRSHPSSVTFQLTDESTNTTATPAVTVANADGFMTITGTFSLKDGRYYMFDVLDGATLVYRGRVFVTSQTDFDKYTVNENQYTEHTSTNDFVILWATLES